MKIDHTQLPLTQQQLNVKATEIARRCLYIPTLEPRHMDRLDFHDLGVGSIKDALVEAIATGYMLAKAESK